VPASRAAGRRHRCRRRDRGAFRRVTPSQPAGAPIHIAASPVFCPYAHSRRRLEDQRDRARPGQLESRGGRRSCQRCERSRPGTPRGRCPPAILDQCPIAANPRSDPLSRMSASADAGRTALLNRSRPIRRACG
jgi:hypothetical protein